MPLNLHSILRFPFKVVVNTFYKKIYIKNKNLILENRPLILALNHPNSFMDALAFSVMYRKKLNSLARGDSFKGVAKWLMNQVGIIPIFRLSDGGREGLKKNSTTFKIVSSRLAINKNIIIFPEGLCVQERRLRSLKKGCAKMAFFAMEENYNPEFAVIPIGINYQNNPSKFRSKLYFILGEPIYLKDYMESYRANAPKTINSFTLFLQERMKELVIHINNFENDELVEQLEEMLIEEILQKKEINKNNLEARHAITRTIVAKINLQDQLHPEKLQLLREKLVNYFQELKAKGIRDKLFRENYAIYSSFFPLLLSTLLFFSLLPFWILGLVLNYPPYLFSIKVGKKLGKTIEWFASVAALVGAFAFFFYYLLQNLLVYILFHDLEISIIFFPIPFLVGFFSVHFSPFRKKLIGSFRYWKLKKKTIEFEKLKTMRTQILSEFKGL